MRAEDLARLLQGARRSGGGWTARCPAHDDQRASLSFQDGVDGKLLLTCHAGCSVEAIAQALGLSLADLLHDNGAGPQHGKRLITQTYDYRDEDGQLLYQVVRFEPKGFAQRRPDGVGGWMWSLGKVRRVIYRLPELQG